MSLFPKIKRPCPYVSDLDAVVSQGHCSSCDKVVHDITCMTDGERRQLVESHDGNLCVRYTVLRPVLAAMAIGLSTTAAVAADRPAESPRHHKGKAVKAAAKTAHDPPVIAVPMVGAPIMPSPAGDASHPAPDGVTWVKETPAVGND